MQKVHVDGITYDGCINTGNHITMHDGCTQTDNTNYDVSEKEQVDRIIYNYNSDVQKMIDSEYKHKYDIDTGLSEFTNGYKIIEETNLVDIDNNGFIPYIEERTWFDYQALYKKAKCIVSGLDTEDMEDIYEIRHIDFDKNDEARKAVFNLEPLLKDGKPEDDYSELLNGALNCDYKSLLDIKLNIFDYIIENEDFLFTHDMRLIKQNYEWLDKVVQLLS